MSKGTCDFCGWEGRVIHCENPQSESWKAANFCEVCYSTSAGNAFFYPRQYDNAHIMKLISYGINMILKAIKEK